MSEVEHVRDEGRESRTRDRAHLRDHQRQRRVRLTAAPKTRFPWTALVQTLMALVLVAVAAASLDWLQPLELAVAATAFAMCAVATYIVLEKIVGPRTAATANLFHGPITCGASVALIAGTMWMLQRFPESAAYTDRQVMEIQRITDQLLANDDLSGAVSHLETAIDQSESDFWKERWTEKLRTIRGRQAENQSEDLAGQSVFPELVPIPAANTTAQSDSQNSSSTPSAGSANTQSTRDDFRRGASAEASRTSTISLPLNQPDRSESVLNHFIRLQETKGFSVAELYLRELIREEPRSNWQGDYQQWYVDHWIDWGRRTPGTRVHRCPGTLDATRRGCRLITALDGRWVKARRPFFVENEIAKGRKHDTQIKQSGIHTHPTA